MAALPYIQLYVSDYLADTAHLSLEEHGAYLILIMNYWQSGRALPDDDKRLQRVCRADADQWSRIRPALEEFFDIKDGFWFHSRIERDLERVNSKSESARKAAQSKKKSPYKSSAKPAKRTQSERKANAKRTGSHTYTYTDKDTDKNKTTERRCRDSFERFWETVRPKWFGQPGNKQEALKAWGKLNPDDLLAERITRAALRDAEYRRRVHANHEFIPNMKHASGWINNRCWEDVQDNPSAKSEIQAMVDSFKGCI